MRQTIRKWFWVWNFDKEEKWLNKMAAKGLSLVSVGFCKYEFEDSMPGEYKVCLQLLDKMPRHPESQKYIEFLEATGAEHIGNFTRWAYFRKKSKDGEFELFSDNASRIKYLSGVISSIALITVANCIVGINNVFFGYQSFQFGELFKLYKSCHWNFGNLWLYQAAKKTQKNETRMSIV